MPAAPGLGFAINAAAIKEQLVPEAPGFVDPTPVWDAERSWDHLWS